MGTDTVLKSICDERVKRVGDSVLEGAVAGAGWMFV